MSEQPKHPVETPKEWLRYAIEDFGVAEREIQYSKPSYHTVCFLCQSAAEKFLKGFLIAHGWKLQKTHDIITLLGFCSDHDAELGAMINEGAILNEYIVSGRYPDVLAFEDIGQLEAEEAVKATRRIYRRVMTVIGSL